MPLVGFLSTSQQVTFGKTKTGGIIYKIKCFNHYPSTFLISYNGKLKGKIIFTFKIINEEKHIGEIINVIGLMEESNLLLTLQYIYNIFRKNIIKIKLENNLELLVKRPYIDKYIFSIDPLNSMDIDDALSFEEYDDYNIVSVYIAQPICFLSEDKMIETCKVAFSTLYNYPRTDNNNLWGNIITDESSLLMGKQRPVYVIEFYINKNNEFINYKHYSAIITNKYQTNYDSCLQNPIIKKLFNFTEKLYNISHKKANELISSKKFLIFSSHELVSYWMLNTNNYLGKSEESKLYKIPYRVMKKSINEFIDVDTEIKTVFMNKISESAKYALNDLENYHSALDKFDYIHFTSPIRRIIDTLIHWCITYKINFEDLLNKYNITIDDINVLDKSTKKYHQSLKLLDNIINLPWIIDDKQNYYVLLEGWIFKIKELKDNNFCATVYFKEIGFHKVKSELINLCIGNKYNFKVYKKNDFLPYDKILIIFI
jgi:exoribonuclease R